MHFPRFVLLVIGLVSSAHLLAQNPYELAHQPLSLPVVRQPTDGWLFDPDNDGDLDALVSHFHVYWQGSAYRMAYIENLGDSWSTSWSQMHCSQLIDVRFADMDHDGDLDIVATGRAENLGYYEFDNGGYSTWHEIHDTEDWVDIEVADFDNDGWMDVVGINEDLGVVGMFYNLGSGAFDDLVVIKDDLDGANSLAIGDFNSNGNPDIAASWDDKIWWWANNGSGTFGGGNSLISLYGHPVTLAAGDFDNDGDADLISTASSEHPTRLFKRTSGSWEDPVELPFFTSDRVMDYDGDGDLDLIDVGSWLPNNGDATFGAGVAFLLPNMAGTGGLGDLDGDGDMDMLGSEWFTSAGVYDQIRTLENDGTDTFTFGEVLYTPVTEDIRGADLSGDSRHEILGHRHGRLMMHTDEDGLFDLGVLLAEADDLSGISIGDADLDGDLDVFFCTAAAAAPFRWVENLGDGAFGGITNLPGTTDFARDVRVEDLDGDGDADLVGISDTEASVYLNTNGNFSLLDAHPLTAHETIRVQVGDVDGDGWKDLVVPTLDGEVLALPLTAGGLGDALTLNTYEAPLAAMATGDWNGDGLLDVWVSTGDEWGTPTNSILYFQANGSGGFEPEHIFWADDHPVRSMLVTDANLDGMDDVIIHTDYYTKVLLLRNAGNGEIAGTSYIGITSNPDGYSDVYGTADINGDGALDFVLTRQWFTTITLNVMLEGCTDPAACNYSVTAVDDDGSCCYSTCGCTSVLASNYDPTATCDDGSCAYIEGCTNAYASNYDPDAQSEDGSCIYPTGCTDPVADNYNPSAVLNTGGCTYVGGCTDPIAENYDPEATADDGSCTYILGCTDPIAENYNPDATMDDGSCTYVPGCTQSHAVNFNPDASQDDGSCQFLFAGVVWDDVNGDGVHSVGETGLPFREVVVEGQGITLITDDQGAWEVILPEGTYSFIPETDDAYPFTTTVDNLMVPSTFWTISQIEIGLSAEEPAYHVCVDLYSSAFQCNAWVYHTIHFRNMSNQVVDAVIEVERDPLYAQFLAVTPIDSVQGLKLYYSYEGLNPGQMEQYTVRFLSPTAAFIGETLISTAQVWGYNDEGEEVATGSTERVREVNCAYDPNDKQAFPEGYGDDHLLLSGTEQEFLVRFQNTGTAPAQNVVIRDTLDVHFDISTFELVAHSHSVMTTLNEITREVVFTFNDIQLPDSVCCEAESQGLVSYRVRSFPELEVGTRLENTAYIYFDNNAPIVTNTTWTTIHVCGQDLGFDYVLQPECPLWLPAVQSDYVETPGLPSHHSWTADGELSSLEPSLLLPLYYTGTIQVTISDPLCTESGQVEWEPVLDVVWDTCPGDVDCDEYIDAGDLLAVLGNLGCTVPECLFEITGDGLMNAEDLLLILGQFGLHCE